MKIKIAVNGSFLVKPLTGVQRYAREMIQGLKSIGFEDLLILSPGQYPDSDFIGFKVIRDTVPIPWFNQWWVWEQVRLPFMMKQYPGYLLWSPSNIGPLRVSKQIVTMHDALVFAGPQWFSFAGGTYYRWLLPRLAKRVKHIITDSSFSKSELLRYGVVQPKNVSVVQLGISQDFLRSGSLRTEQKQDTSEDFILNLGSRDPRKNIKRLIAAWHKVDPDLKRGVKLFVVGGQIKGVVNEGLGNAYDDDIIFLGYKKDEEIRELYRKAMFFVFPSLYEGFGLPPLEAMACGAPVIVSDVASLPEACGEAALYCNPIDENDIALKITTMLTDEALRRRLQREGLARAKGFTWERSAEAFLNVISTIGIQ